MTTLSVLSKLRQEYSPSIPRSLASFATLRAHQGTAISAIDPAISPHFPHTSHPREVSFNHASTNLPAPPLKIGVLFSGGQAPGGHNVISGLLDYIKALNTSSTLLGFIAGPDGLIKNKWIDLTETIIAPYRNQGGFDLLGSSRTKIETAEQFNAVAKVVKELDLDGLLIIGGDDSNTNAAILAEYFLANQIRTKVVGVPKTIDGDLKNSNIEISFGFDTATKVYSNLIGNVARDAISAKKYYHFIKLMGRSASHVTLECALNTKPNAVIIGEEVAAKKMSLKAIVDNLCDIIIKRAASSKEYGIILVPEGLLEFIPSCKSLISELNHLLAGDSQNTKTLEGLADKDKKIAFTADLLSDASKATFTDLPSDIQLQLLLDRDPHGNIQVSQIETERLLIGMVATELQKRKKDKSYQGSFRPVSHFLGYEGRSSMPSDFDAQYCYSLGLVAGILLKSECTGYMAIVKNLAKPVSEWQPAGVPLISMMSLETRHGKVKPVISKFLVDLQGAPFNELRKNRDEWSMTDDFGYIGPIQYFGPKELTEAITLSLELG